MLTTTCKILQKAYEGHYTVPAVNAQGGTYGIIWVVRMAAEEFRSPVILTHYVDIGACSGHGWFHKAARWVAGKVPMPVAIRLDHGDSPECCMEMLRPGFTSIILDNPILPVKEDTATTEVVTRVYRSFGVPLETEIGELCRLDDRGNRIGTSSIADPDVVRQYLKPYRSDSLAIGIGNAHGFYSGPMDIRVEVSGECGKFIDIPLVLHSCASMNKESVKCSIGSGVARIDSDTQVHCQYVNYLKKGLVERGDQGYAWKLSQYAELRPHENMKDIIRLVSSKEKT